MSVRAEAPAAAFDGYQHAPCGLLTTASDGRIERVNQTLCLWLNLAATELLERRFQDLLTIGSKLFHHTHWMPLLQMQRSVAEVQLELLRSDGQALPMLVNAAHRDHCPEAASGDAKIDIALFVATDRRKYERELLLARSRAEELLESEREAQLRAANLLKQSEFEARQRAVVSEQLIGIVSHDLRTPLNAVALGAGLLRAAELGEHARTVRRIGAAAERANRLIADLLDFTQARLGGGLSVNLRSINPHEIVAECIEELKFTWPGRLLNHIVVGEGVAEADPDRLAQVLSNLVNNALVYGDPTAPVTVTSRVQPSSLELTVHNLGPPVPEAKRAQIFEPLQRGEQLVSQGLRSVGLGLYIVQEIAKAHGGRVTLHSEPGQGTSFVLELPSPLPEPALAP